MSFLAALPAQALDPGSYHGQTNLHPIGLALVVVLGLATILVPRKHAVVPCLLLACFVSPAQRLVIASLDFNLVRIMVIFAWLRVLMRGEYTHLRWTTLDRLLVTWALVGAVVYCLLHGTMGAFVNRLGRAYDFVGMYLFFRCVIRSWKDFDHIVRAFSLIAIPVGIAFVAERITGRNMFAFMGGVPEMTKVREGQLRCQGPFPHAILAGCFWVTLLPMMISRWWHPSVTKISALFTVGLVLMIVGLTSSATPLMGVTGGLIAVAAYPFRRNLKVLRWGGVLLLLMLHFVMQAPAWHLISRVDLVGGSSGYHRYMLIDRFVANAGEWWILGVRSTDHWGPYMRDMANQYIVEGVRGGSIRLVLFLGILAFGFKEAGLLIRTLRRNKVRSKQAYALGATLMMQATMFFGIAISYSQQNMMLFTLTLSMLVGLRQATVHEARAARMVALRPGVPDRTSGVGTAPVRV